MTELIDIQKGRYSVCCRLHVFGVADALLAIATFLPTFVVLAGNLRRHYRHQKLE